MAYYQSRHTLTPPKASCVSNTGTLVSPPFHELSKESPSAIIANLEDRAKAELTFKVIEVLKGDYVTVGEKVRVCTTIQTNMDYRLALILLKGRDRTTGQWVVTQDYMGIFPNTNKNTFKINQNESPVGIDELKRRL